MHSNVTKLYDASSSLPSQKNYRLSIQIVVSVSIQESLGPALGPDRIALGSFSLGTK